MYLLQLTAFSRSLLCSSSSRLKSGLTMATTSSLLASLGFQPDSRPSSDMAAFRKEFAKAKHIVVLTGAGVSAESGVPTFRGAGGYWRTWQATDLATPQAFAKNPSLVWEFYHYRREVMLSKHPNPAHIAIAECQKRLKREGRRMVVITQNIDELHETAGSTDIIELHGSLFRVRCTSCGQVEANRDSPICPSLSGKGAPNPESTDAQIPAKDLPRSVSVYASMSYISIQILT
jgi:NAD-dependent deacetylase sirtuin 5